MSNVLVDRQKIDILANAISAKSGESIPLTFSEMVNAVDGIEIGSGGSATIEALSVTQNGTYTAPSGVDGYSPVTVDIGAAQIRGIQIPSSDFVPTQTLSFNFDVDNNGLIYVTYGGIGNATFAYQPGLVTTSDAVSIFILDSDSYQLPTQTATAITPTESIQTAVAAGKYTTGAVTVNAISSTYVGSGITRRSSTDLTVSGATVSVPAGYYSEAASKSVSLMTLPTSAASSATSGYTSKATIGRSTAAQYINIPSGYNSTGAYYVISAVANGSATAPATISGTAATVSTGTNTLTLTKTVSVTPTVSAGYVSSGTAGNSSVSLTASITTKAAATYHPSTTAQTISASQYLTGAQTIAAVTTTNLSASNIVSGVTIKVGDSSDDDCVASVTGNVVLQNYYTGSSAPSSSLGNNGDLYLQS